jgi:hypothetical protein
MFEKRFDTEDPIRLLEEQFETELAQRIEEGWVQ